MNASPQGLLMTLLGAHLQPRDRPVWAGGLITLLESFGYSPGATRVALTRLVARGTFVRTKTGRHSSYTLTPQAAAILAEGDTRIFTLGRRSADDAGWTILWHTVPECQRLERSRLTRRLRFLGFGQLQDGTWIAPRDHTDDVIRLLDELGLREHSSLMVGQPSSAQDIRQLVDRAWDLDELDKSYRRFKEDFCRYGETSVRAALDGEAALVVRTRLTHAFRQFPTLDPDLPPNIAPSPEHRATAVALFHEVYEALAERSIHHFTIATQLP